MEQIKITRAENKNVENLGDERDALRGISTARPTRRQRLYQRHGRGQGMRWSRTETWKEMMIPSALLLVWMDHISMHFDTV